MNDLDVTGSYFMKNKKLHWTQKLLKKAGWAPQVASKMD